MLEAEFQDRAATRMLDGIHDRLNDDDLLRVLADDLSDYEREMFATAGHGAWAADDPVTVALKGGSKVLVNTGGLLDELTGGGAIDVSGDELTLKSSTPYAGYLKAGARGLPKRDPVPPPEGSDTQTWAEHLLEHIVEGHR